jgi:hypothetical protein
MLMDAKRTAISYEKAFHHAATINAYWAERGRQAGAKVVPLYDHPGVLVSYGVESSPNTVVPPPSPEKAAPVAVERPDNWS